MQSNSLTTGLYAWVGLLPAPHNIPVVEDTLAVVHTLAADDTLVALDILVVDILEAASAALQILVVAAQVGPPVSQAPLLAALQVVLLLLVALQVAGLPLAVRVVASGCSWFISFLRSPIIQGSDTPQRASLKACLLPTQKTSIMN